MADLALYGLLPSLFASVYFSIFYVLQATWNSRRSRFSGDYSKSAAYIVSTVNRLPGFRLFMQRTGEMLEATGSAFSAYEIAAASFGLMLFGVGAGAFGFQTCKAVLILAVVFGCSPYILLRLRLINSRLRLRLEFLPAVEVFYQYYLIDANSSVKAALKACLDESRILYPMKPVFEQLYRNLLAHRDMEESLQLFSTSLGHVWADDFAAMVRVSLLEGCWMGDSLKELITDMRQAKRFDQAERTRLLEIRLANFTPALFLLLFLCINFRLNAAASYAFYVLDPDGRSLLLDALLLIFASFLMGVYLSLRRM